jgi:hypothetical protein
MVPRVNQNIDLRMCISNTFGDHYVPHHPPQEHAQPLLAHRQG